jgi:hypothetical protein
MATTIGGALVAIILTYVDSFLDSSVSCGASSCGAATSQ